MTSERPAKCPRCGSARVASLLYAPEGADRKPQEELRARRAVPADHARTGNDPRWRCLNCRMEWGYPRGFSGATAGIDDLA